MLDMLKNINFSITFEDVVYAAVAALILTWLIKTFSKIRKILKNPSSMLNYSATDIKNILQRCYVLFPKDILSFGGETYKRGMLLKITTLQNKTFEGEFIGCNERDMFCMLTQKYIIAHEINNIETIQILDKF